MRRPRSLELRKKDLDLRKPRLSGQLPTDADLWSEDFGVPFAASLPFSLAEVEADPFESGVLARLAIVVVVVDNLARQESEFDAVRLDDGVEEQCAGSGSGGRGCIPTLTQGRMVKVLSGRQSGCDHLLAKSSMEGMNHRRVRLRHHLQVQPPRPSLRSSRSRVRPVWLLLSSPLRLLDQPPQPPQPPQLSPP